MLYYTLFCETTEKIMDILSYVACVAGACSTSHAFRVFQLRAQNTQATSFCLVRQQNTEKKVDYKDAENIKKFT